MKTCINASARSLKKVSSWIAWPVAALLMLAWLAFGEAARAATNYEPYTITHFAGSLGEPGYSDGTGSDARFNVPDGIAVDASGNVYVADRNNNTIRKITPDGVVSTLAGRAGFAGGDDGTGSDARFYWPSGVAVDSAGNVYVADAPSFDYDTLSYIGGHTIRKITPSGVVTTLAGLAGSSGSADGTGSAARFNEPSGVAVDSAGNVYVADWRNNTIRKITPGGVVSTLAGLASPFGVAVDSSGNVYVAATFNFTIHKITPGGVVSTLAGRFRGGADGTGSAARFAWPYGVAVDSAGNVYVADSPYREMEDLSYRYGHTIRKITPSGVVTTLAGLAGIPGGADGTGSAARFASPKGVAVDSAGNVYVADTGNNTIRKGWVSPLRVFIAPDGSGGFFIRVQGRGNLSYQLQRAQTLNGQWITNAVQTAPGSGLVEFHDPSPPSDRGFYRAFQE